MKNFLLSFSTLWLFFAYSPAHSSELKTVEFNKETYKLANVKKTQASSINEYVLDGQTLQNWKKMVALHRFHSKNKTSPIQFANGMAALLGKMYKKPVYKVMENKQNGEAIISFVVPGKANKNNDKDNELYLEQNIFKYRSVDNSNDVEGYQYAYRIYGITNQKEMETALGNIKQNEMGLIKMVTDQPFPEFIE